MDIKKIKSKALKKLEGNYIIIIIALFIYGLVEGFCNGTSKLIYNENMSIFFNIIVKGLLYMGLLQIVIKIARGKKTDIMDLFNRTDMFWKCAAITIILTAITTLCAVLEYIAFSSLTVFVFYQTDMNFILAASMIIVGILLCAAIATFYIVLMVSFSQVYYILYENEKMPVLDIFEKSMDLMEKHKLDYLLLELSFVGWIFIGIVTLGVLYLWLIPYMQVSQTIFYDELIKPKKKINK